MRIEKIEAEAMIQCNQNVQRSFQHTTEQERNYLINFITMVL